VARIERVLWDEDRPPGRFGAVLDILGFTAFMRRQPSLAHVQLQNFGAHVASAIGSHGGGLVDAAIFSDGAYLASDDVAALADVAMETVFRTLVHTPTFLVHGLIAYGDYRLVPTSHAAVPQIHWAGQGVLEIGLKEKLLPKGAMIFVDPSVEPHVGGLPTARARLLWSHRLALDWAADPNRAGLFRVAWGNVLREPAFIAQVAATKVWMRQVAAVHGISLP
jgi:hypothetical protein